MLIDSRGRLFGRFNLVDLAVVVFLALVVPGGYVAYRVFRIPPPEIVRVTPSLFTPETPLRLRLEGRHFRPYLVAVLGKAGEPLSLNRIVLQATFLLQTPEEVELELPKMDPGTYDIHLFDEATEVAVRTAALVVEPERGATIEVRVRFVMLPAVVPLVREGDRDRWERGSLNER